jgi:hypothetical protein
MSKLPNFSADYLRSILDYDPWNGMFTWKVNFRQPCYFDINKKAGCKNNITGYLQVGIHKKIYLLHLLSWYYMFGEWPLQDIDHKNRIRDDNRFENLRLITKSTNAVNSIKQKNRTSNYKGVYWNKQKNKWQAQIMKNYKQYYLGSFDDPIEAAKVYDKKAIELFDDYAVLNF